MVAFARGRDEFRQLGSRLKILETSVRKSSARQLFGWRACAVSFACEFLDRGLPDYKRSMGLICLRRWGDIASGKRQNTRGRTSTRKVVLRADGMTSPVRDREVDGKHLGHDRMIPCSHRADRHEDGRGGGGKKNGKK